MLQSRSERGAPNSSLAKKTAKFRSSGGQPHVHFRGRMDPTGTGGPNRRKVPSRAGLASSFAGGSVLVNAFKCPSRLVRRRPCDAPFNGAIVPRRIGPAISETHARGPIANLTKLHTNLKVALLCPVPPAADSGSHFDPHCTRAIGLVQTTADGFESCERHDDDADTKVRTSADRELEEASAVHRRSREQAGSALSKYPPR